MSLPQAYFKIKADVTANCGGKKSSYTLLKDTHGCFDPFINLLLSTGMDQHCADEVKTALETNQQLWGPELAAMKYAQDLADFQQKSIENAEVRATQEAICACLRAKLEQLTEERTNIRNTRCSMIKCCGLPLDDPLTQLIGCELGKAIVCLDKAIAAVTAAIDDYCGNDQSTPPPACQDGGCYRIEVELDPIVCTSADKSCTWTVSLLVLKIAGECGTCAPCSDADPNSVIQL